MALMTEMTSIITKYDSSPEIQKDMLLLVDMTGASLLKAWKKKAAKSQALPSPIVDEVMRQIPEELSDAVLTQIKQLVHDLVELQLSPNPECSADDLISKSITELSSKFPEIAAIAQDKHNSLLLSIFFHQSASYAQESITKSIDKHSSAPLATTN